jgi:hypothetical protein
MAMMVGQSLARVVRIWIIVMGHRCLGVLIK